MEKIRLGYAPIVEPIFDAVWAKKLREQTITLLSSFDDVDLIMPKEVVTIEDDAIAAGELFRDQNVDVLIMQSINSDSGILATAMGQKVRRPILLWSTPEPSLHDTPVVANSTCGSMIIAGTLRRLGLKYHHVHGFPDSKELVEELKRAIDAAATVARLLDSKIGLVGYVPPGFHHSAADELLMRKTFGIKVHHIDLSELFSEAESRDPKEIQKEISEIKEIGTASDAVTETDFEKTAKIGLAMRHLSSKYSLKAQAVKCFPEFQSLYGAVPCAAMGRCNDKGLNTSCEADLGGALTMLVENFLSRQPVFFVDIISLDDNIGVVWHCGNGVSSLADPNTTVRYDKSPLHGHSITTEMVCRPGPVTVARFSQREDRFRLYAFEGQAITGDPTLRGASMKIEFGISTEQIKKVIFDDGIENHFAVAYGHIGDQLGQVAKWLEIESRVWNISGQFERQPD